MIKKLLVLFGLITVNAFCDPTYTNKEQVLACMRRRNYPNFHIQEKDIVPDTIEAIKAALEVRDFECVVHGKRLSPDKIELVLKLRSRLKRLYFVEEQTSETVGYIAEMLSRNGGLTSLTLECSPIDDDNAKLIAEALKTNTTLTLLTLGRCNMTDVGARSIMAPSKDILNYSKHFAQNQICCAMGGRIAEEMTFQEQTSGASADIKAATKMARRMVCDWGMSSLGPVCFGENQEHIFLGKEIAREQNYSERTAQQIDDTILSIVKEQYERARKILEEKKEALETLAQALLKYETLDGKHVYEIVEKGEIVSEVVTRPAAKEEKDSEDIAKKDVEKPSDAPASEPMQDQETQHE